MKFLFSMIVVTVLFISQFSFALDATRINPNYNFVPSKDAVAHKAYAKADYALQEIVRLEKIIQNLQNCIYNNVCNNR